MLPRVRRSDHGAERGRGLHVRGRLAAHAATLAQTLTGFFACWVLGALIGAVTGALCHRRRSPSCARVYPPKRIARHVHSSAPVPVVVSSVAAMLALLLLVIPSFPQEKLVSVAWLVTSLIHLQVDLPAGYCKSMNATWRTTVMAAAANAGHQQPAAGGGLDVGLRR